MNYSGFLWSELSKWSKWNALFQLGYQKNTDASIFVYKFRTERTGFNMYTEYTQPQWTFLALVLWHHPWRTKSYSDTKTNRILPITLLKVKQCISRFILKISITGLRNSNKGRKGQTMDWQHLIVMSVTLHC